MKKLLFLLMLISSGAMANGACTNVSGPNEIALQTGSIQITNPEDNTSGHIQNNAYSWDGYNTTFSCDCPQNNGYWTFSSIVYLPDEGSNWFKLNDYLDIRQTINTIAGVGSATMPFTNLVASKQACPSKAQTYPKATGTIGTIDLRIRKPFIGTSFINNIKVSALYTCNGNDGICSTAGQPTDEYYFTGVVTVPQNCTINAGTQISVPLGTLYSGDFKTVGEKPANFTPKTFNVPIKCNDLSASANLTLRIQGTQSAGVSDALASDNADVGVVITDSDGNIMKPNDATSLIPFTLDGNDSANITLHAYPVSTTGNTPAEGLFTTLAYLRVDFA